MDGSKLVVSKQWFIDSHQGNIKDVYHFVERLGSGGFGVVYLAEDRKTSKCSTKSVTVNPVVKSKPDSYRFCRNAVCSQSHSEEPRP
jgi:serine/threonine protein kinase